MNSPGARIWLLISALSFGGCATMHYGDETHSADRKFAMSCDIDRSIAHKRFAALVCSLENKSTEWQIFEVTSLKVFAADKTPLHVSEPSEIEDFYTAYRFEHQTNAHNTDMVIAGLLVGGMAAMTSSDSAVGSSGAASVVGASVFSTGRSMSERHNDIQYGTHAASYSNTLFGPGHLLTPQTRIPSDLFVRKRVLVESASVNESPASLQVCFAKPSTECLVVPVYMSGRGECRSHVSGISC